MLLQSTIWILPLSALFIWAIVSLIGSGKARPASRLARLVGLGIAALWGVYFSWISELKSFAIVLLIAAGFATFLLPWTLWKIASQTKKQQRVRWGYWLGLLLALTAVALICSFILVVFSGLSHSAEPASLLRMKCLLTFLLIVACPMLGLWLASRVEKRWVSLALLVVCLGPIPFSVTIITPGAHGRILDEHRQPVRGAYVYYEQIPAQPGPSFREGLLRTDGNGDFVLSPRIDFQIPFLYSLPFESPRAPQKLSFIVYAPSLNNYCRIEDAWSGRSAQEGRQLQIERPSGRWEFILFDMSGRPEEYYSSLHELSYGLPIRRQLRSLEDKKEFAAALADRYRLFAETYGKRLREGQSVEGELKSWDFFLGQTEAGRTMAEELKRLESQLNPAKPASAGPWLPAARSCATWPTSGADSLHTRSVAAPAIQTPTLKARLGDFFAKEVLFTDVNADGTLDLVVCGLGKDFAALSGQDGRPLWQFRVAPNSWSFSFPSIDGDLLFCAVTDNRSATLYALEVSTGKPAWQRTLEGPGATCFIGSPVVDGDWVYFMVNWGVRSRLYAFSKRDGTPGAEFDVEGGVSPGSLPLVRDGRLYCLMSTSSRGKTVTAIDLATQAVVWRFETASEYYVPSPLLAAGRLFIGDDHGRLNALGAADGQPVWRYETGDRSIGTDPAMRGGTLCIEATDGNLYALDPLSGRLKWQFSGNSQSASCCIAGDVVYAASADGYLFALRLADGRKLWEYPIGSTPYGRLSTCGPMVAVPLPDRLVLIGEGASQADR